MDFPSAPAPGAQRTFAGAVQDAAVKVAALGCLVDRDRLEPD